jgi:hypothetical protein
VVDKMPTNFKMLGLRQKISNTAVDRWRNYERFVGPLRRLG